MAFVLLCLCLCCSERGFFLICYRVLFFPRQCQVFCFFYSSLVFLCFYWSVFMFFLSFSCVILPFFFNWSFLPLFHLVYASVFFSFYSPIPFYSFLSFSYSSSPSFLIIPHFLFLLFGLMFLIFIRPHYRFSVLVILLISLITIFLLPHDHFIPP